MTSVAALSFVNVSFGYRRGRPVFQDFSWTTGSGVTAVLGPNGAGKTTLFELAAMQRTPWSGVIEIAGNETRGALGRTKAQTFISYLPQRFNFLGWMRVREVVIRASWAGGTVAADVESASLQAMEEVGLDGMADARVRSLSGGMRQRLGIACAISHQPQLLLLDEPAVGLDPRQRVTLRGLLTDLGSRRSVILSTHLVDDVVRTADRLMVLERGNIKYDGCLAQLIGSGPIGERQSLLEAAYLTMTDSDSAAN